MSSVTLDAATLARELESCAKEFAVNLGPEEVGRVLQAGNGIAMVDGLPGVMAEEMVIFPDEVCGMAMNLHRDTVGVVILGDYANIEQGDLVRRSGRILDVPVGDGLLGRVVTPLGQPLDGKGPIAATERRHIESDAPGVVDREPVNRPLQTGLKTVDAMTAIGRGQRELIIGDRQTGKTTVAIDAILNQTAGDVACIYVAIGQKMSTVAGVVDTLTAAGVMDNCIVVVATASDSAPQQYIAPFAGCAMGEFFRDAGRDALIVYDDLSKHAVAYREMSLLLRRPPGREAYPGDIFYLHSRLLERAAKLHPDRGNGSLTALPIAETQQGDYSAYIPTNLVSITDGQIYLEGSLFHQGFRPAMNVGLSVSRVGGKAQLKAMKQVAARLRLDLAQYREVASFAQLTSDLDPATLKQLRRGERLAEILKQPQHKPLPVEQQVCSIWAAVNGHLDIVPLSDVERFLHEWYALVTHAYSDVGREIRETGTLSSESETALGSSMEQFLQIFVPTGEVVTPDGGRTVMPPDGTNASLSETALRTDAYGG